jgi:cobaltochelatase CobS
MMAKQEYWHDTDGARGRKMFCLSCGDKVRNGEIIVPEVPVSETPETPAEHAEYNRVMAAPQGDLAAMLAQAIQSHLTLKPTLDEKRVKELIAQHVNGPTPITVEILDYKSNEVRNLGIQHKQFPALLRAAQARDKDGFYLNHALYGCAGDGKTTACEMVCKALGLKYVILNAKPHTLDFFGYRAVSNGDYVRTLARDMWEHGGVIIFDDFDRNPSDVSCELNSPLANGHCTFPDAVVPRHKDCLIFLTANTPLNGGTADFNGATKQDAAFADRFVLRKWNIDEELESATCGNSAWAKRVQQVRRKVSEKGIKALVTPRASYKGAALLNAGVPQSEVEDTALRGAMTPHQWESVC